MAKLLLESLANGEIDERAIRWGCALYINGAKEAPPELERELEELPTVLTILQKLPARWARECAFHLLENDDVSLAGEI